jgi:hypothetical protein
MTQSSTKANAGTPSSRRNHPVKLVVDGVLWSICLTFLLYLLAFYFLPPPPPSAPVVSLFAFMAVVLVYVARGMVRKSKSRRSRQ